MTSPPTQFGAPVVALFRVDLQKNTHQIIFGQVTIFGHLTSSYPRAAILEEGRFQRTTAAELGLKPR